MLHLLGHAAAQRYHVGNAPALHDQGDLAKHVAEGQPIYLFALNLFAHMRTGQ
jgi:hypothetical protein